MLQSPGRVHLLGAVATIGVAIGILATLVPYCANNYFTPPLKGYDRLRGEVFYYLVIGLIPIALWLVPSFVRRLAYLTIGVHERFFGRSGFYIRFPTKRSTRFRTTFLMALGPFAVDMLAIVNVEYYFTNLHQSAARGSIYVSPLLLLMAAGITAFVPGAWLVSQLGLRLSRPKRGEVASASAIFDGLLGPLSAIALMISFVTTLQSASFSYEAGAFALGVWGLRLFPQVLAAVSLYRIWIEPRVLPDLEVWCDRRGIDVRRDLAEKLEELKKGPSPNLRR